MLKNNIVIYNSQYDENYLLARVNIMPDYFAFVKIEGDAWANGKFEYPVDALKELSDLIRGEEL